MRLPHRNGRKGKRVTKFNVTLGQRHSIPIRPPHGQTQVESMQAGMVLPDDPLAEVWLAQAEKEGICTNQTN